MLMLDDLMTFLFILFSSHITMISLEEHTELQEQLSQSSSKLEMAQQDLSQLKQELEFLKSNSPDNQNKRPLSSTATAVASIERKQLAKYQEELDRLKTELTRAYRRIQELDIIQRQSLTYSPHEARQRRSSTLCDDIHLVLKELQEILTKILGKNHEEGYQNDLTHQEIYERVFSCLTRLEILLDSLRASSDSKYYSCQNCGKNDTLILGQHQAEVSREVSRLSPEKNRKDSTKIPELLNENTALQQHVFIAQVELHNMEQSHRLVLLFIYFDLNFLRYVEICLNH